MRSPRRYYLLNRFTARVQCLEEEVWQSKQEAIAAPPLPDDFPSRAALIAAGYTAVDDVDGASPAELRQFAKLSNQAAQAVLAAVAAL